MSPNNKLCKPSVPYHSYEANLPLKFKSNSLNGLSLMCVCGEITEEWSLLCLSSPSFSMEQGMGRSNGVIFNPNVAKSLYLFLFIVKLISVGFSGSLISLWHGSWTFG